MSYWKQRQVKSPEEKTVRERFQFWKHHRESAMTTTRTKTKKDEEEAEAVSLVSITKAIENLSKQMQSMNQGLTQEIKACKVEIKTNSKEIKACKEELNKKLDDWKEESDVRFTRLEEDMSKNITEISEIQSLSTEIVKEVETLQTWSIAADEKIELLETQGKIRNLRFRGVPEDFGKSDLKKEFTEAIEEFIQPKQPVIIEKIYRVNSREASRRKLSRDIFVAFESKTVRDEIWRKQRANSLQIKDQSIAIFQDLPRTTLTRRAEFDFLRRVLIQRGIRYYWKIPFALEVILTQGKQTIRTIEEAKELADQLASQPVPKPTLPPPLAPEVPGSSKDIPVSPKGTPGPPKVIVVPEEKIPKDIPPPAE